MTTTNDGGADTTNAGPVLPERPKVPKPAEGGFGDYWTQEQIEEYADVYGRQCAEHVAGPLRERVAELERRLEESESMLDSVISKAPEPLRELGGYIARLTDEDQWPQAERYLNAASIACDRLCAEVEALRADAERWRWFRLHVTDIVYTDEEQVHQMHGKWWDEKIDAARAAREGS